MKGSFDRTQSSDAVLITGCSSGIGKAIALRLARSRDKHGWSVWATARKQASIAELQSEGCQVLELDVDDEASMEAAVRTVEQAHGSVGVLVNNAGYAQLGAIEAVPIERVRKQFETNVFGLVRLTQLVLPGMRKRGSGRIINMSSVGGKLTFPGGGYYHASKHAVEAISDALRFEVRGFGIHVVLIEPGLVNSGFSEAGVASMQLKGDLKVYDDFHATIARATKELYQKGLLARLSGTPEDVAVTVEHAILREKPRARYTVTPAAKLLLAQRRLLSDRAWDAAMRSNFPSPGEGGAEEPSAKTTSKAMAEETTSSLDGRG